MTRKRLAAICGSVALLAVGVFAAVALAATTGTVSVCATATAASHTVGVDGTPVSTVGGDTATNCATSTYTIPDPVTETVTTTVPGPTTTVTTTVGTTTTPAPSTGGTPGIGALCYGGCLKNFSNLDQYSMVIGSSFSSDTSLLASAAGRSLTYFDGTDVSVNYSTGVPYADASANSWLLKDSAGNLLRNSQYGDYAGDIGSSGYQQAWITNVESYLSAHPGLDGIFIDNVLYDPKGDFGAYPAKYPDTASWDTATVAFAKAIYSALHAKGYYVALNAGAYKSGDAAYNDGSSVVSWFKTVGPYGDGLMNEHYDQTADGTNRLRSTGAAWYQNFDAWQRVVGTAQSQGDDFIGLSKSTSCTDTTTMTYTKASFLMEWNGGGSAYIFTCGTADPANTAWTKNIGTPVGVKFAVGVGYQRNYTAGTVLVNPSPTASQTFTVNGSSYALAPTTARILTSS